MARGANVKVLPPLLYAGPLILLWLLDKVVPLRMSWGALDPVRSVVGWALVVLGLALMAWAGWAMTRAGTTVIPWSQVDALVTRPPFTFTRNPIYLSDILVYLGVTLLLATWWPLIGLPVIIWATVHFVIRHEEAYLRRRFGAPYEAYLAKVRRFI